MGSPRRAAAAVRAARHAKARRYELELHGVARAKGRPRFSGAHAYTPEGTRDWETTVAKEFVVAHGKPRLEGPVRVEIEFNQKRGDLDNLAKAILDALNEIAYVDDQQVCALILSRPWEPKGRARTTIVVEEMR